MQAPGVTVLASKSHSKADLDHRKPVEEGGDDAYQSDMKVRCPCGSSLMSDSMIRVMLLFFVSSGFPYSPDHCLDDSYFSLNLQTIKNAF